MDFQLNELGQPVGLDMSDWKGCAHPPREGIIGRYCRIEPINPAVHAADLHEANMISPDASQWTYLPYGPFDSVDAYRDWLTSASAGDDPIFYAIVDLKTNKTVGLASYLRIVPAQGVIEVGHIHFSPVIQQTPIATESMFLMMRRVFDELGYRRYEWKCDGLNTRSRNAAKRLGFSFDGCFRQAVMYKGRNRDTTWFGMTDGEWPQIKAAFEGWLDEGNFDGDGKQRQSLSAFMPKK